jgi:DNA-directed RNA polymerase subunit RPC12/RpoP
MENLRDIEDNKLVCGGCGTPVGERVDGVSFRPDCGLPEQRVNNECDCPYCGSLLLLMWYMN